MIVYVTGASSGLGLYTARAIAQRGHTVYAGARSFEGGTDPEYGNLHRLSLDVTREESISAFLRQAGMEAAPPDCVVHCAGILMLGSCEETQVEEYRRVMDTDFLGMVRVNQQVLPAMRRHGGGKIVMFSSINGLLGIPFQSAYTAAKHAVEGYAECLQMETHGYGIRVCLVEPGDHRMGSDRYRGHTAGMTEQSPYRRAFECGTAKIHHDETHGSDPVRLGRKVARAIERRSLPFRLRIASPDQHLAVILHDVLPPALNHRILQDYYLRGSGKAHGK